MPDPNKLAALAAAGYVIHDTCGSCVHADFRGPTPWGSCKKIRYQHGKHTGDLRQASIHRSGSCSSFELASVTEADLRVSGFDKFRTAKP
jgi:hypothetical protein